jgi:hypothetical protein
VPARLKHGPRATRWWALAGFLAVAFVLTSPVWRDPSHDWAGVTGDPELFMGYFGWFPFAMTHGINPLLDTYVNVPQGANLMWNTSVPAAALALWPVTALFGVIASYNLALVVALALDGWCTFLWLRRHVHHAAAAWLAGLMMVLGPFASTQAVGHLHVVMFFPVPLMLIALERVATEPGHRRLRWGLAIGALAALQLLLSEEILALLAVVVVTASIVLWFSSPSVVREQVQVLGALRTLLIALCVFVVLAGAPLAYQLFGPERVSGLLQQPDVFVTDLLNLVIPNQFAALHLPSGLNLTSQWSGNQSEADAYIGLPLIAVTVYVLRRWWSDGWTRMVGVGAVVALVWSLGPHVHIGGKVSEVVPLPGVLLTYVPGLSSLVPARFALFMDLGLAGLLACFLDRMCFSGAGWARLGAIGGALLVAATLAPSMPLPVTSSDTPAFFQPGGGARELPAETVALVVPYTDRGPTGAWDPGGEDPTLWQAESDFAFRTVSGAVFTPGTGQYAEWGRSDGVLGCVMAYLQAGASASPCGPGAVEGAREQMDDLGVTIVILGPLDQGSNPSLEGPIREFLTEVVGGPPRSLQGVLVWEYGGPAGAPG